MDGLENVIFHDLFIFVLNEIILLLNSSLNFFTEPVKFCKQIRQYKPFLCDIF